VQIIDLMITAMPGSNPGMAMKGVHLSFAAPGIPSAT
jgi:hypothetical protein